MSYKSRKKKSKSANPLLTAGAGVVLMVVAILAVAGFEYLRPSPQPIAPVVPPTVQRSGEEKFPEIPRISLADSKTAFDEGKITFIDVREVDDYAASHIPGALSIPVDELEARLNELKPGQWLVPYCS